MRIANLLGGALFGATLASLMATSAGAVNVNLVSGAVGADIAVYKELVKPWEEKTGNTVTFVPMPSSTTDQFAQYKLWLAAGNKDVDVYLVDVIWAPQLSEQFLDLTQAFSSVAADHFPSIVASQTVDGRLVALPFFTDAPALYYRKDLLDKAGVQPPKTWAEMQSICDKILPDQSGMSCYGGQFQKYEGLTCNFAEAVNSAGGAVLGDDGKPTVNSAEAVAGLQWMVDGFKSGMIPKEAITWKEEESRTAFQSGKILFLRNWPYVWNLASAKDSKVAGKIAVAPIPGKDGPGVSTLGGHSYGISPFAKNKGTAMKWINWMLTEDNQKRWLQTASSAPVLESLYSDAELNKQFPYLATLGESIKNAKPRPKAVKYGDVTLAIQDAAYAALQGQSEPQAALDGLQTKLQSLVS